MKEKGKTIPKPSSPVYRRATFFCAAPCTGVTLRIHTETEKEPKAIKKHVLTAANRYKALTKRTYYRPCPAPFLINKERRKEERKARGGSEPGSNEKDGGKEKAKG